MILRSEEMGPGNWTTRTTHGYFVSDTRLELCLRKGKLGKKLLNIQIEFQHKWDALVSLHQETGQKLWELPEPQTSRQVSP